LLVGNSGSRSNTGSTVCRRRSERRDVRGRRRNSGNEVVRRSAIGFAVEGRVAGVAEADGRQGFKDTKMSTVVLRTVTDGLDEAK
jgi:hypothetical protein